MPLVGRFLSRLWALLASLFGLALLAAIVLTLYTAATDETDVTALARATACGDAGALACPWVENEYRFVTRTFEFRTPAQESVRVHCARPQIVYGAYACEVRERHPAGLPVAGGGGNTKRPVKPRAPAAAAVAGVDAGGDLDGGAR